MVLLAATNRRMPTYSLVNPPAGMTVRAGSGLIEWTPKAAGSVSVTAELTDTDGAKASRTFTITVQSAGGNLRPEFVSRSTLAAIVGEAYRYEPKTLDANGDAVRYSVAGPEGMKLTEGQITWTPGECGVYPVKVTADDGHGGSAEQAFEVVVLPDPDSAYNEGQPPRSPSYLTVAGTDGGATLVWNTQTLGDNVVQRTADPKGPWTEIGVTPGTWWRDQPPAGAAWYRVLTRNAWGASDPTEPVDGRCVAPLADAGRSSKPAQPELVTLDGSGSFDPAGKPLTYEWTFNAAPARRDAQAGRPVRGQAEVHAAGAGAVYPVPSASATARSGAVRAACGLTWASARCR